MNFHRIQAIVWRQFLPLRRDAYRYVDLFYWPFFDLLVWGFAGALMQKTCSTQTNMILLTALVGWLVINRIHLELAYNLVEEMWSENITNLFATPLSVDEWATASVLTGVIKGSVALVFGTAVVHFLYGLPFAPFLSAVIPFLPLLWLSGWFLGFTALAVLVALGQRANSAIWIIGWCATPFSGIFYPVSVLPTWAQYISHILPTTPIFTLMRTFVETGALSYSAWGTAFLINALCCSLAYGLFRLMFARTKKTGLAQLNND